MISLFVVKLPAYFFLTFLYLKIQFLEGDFWTEWLQSI